MNAGIKICCSPAISMRWLFFIGLFFTCLPAPAQVDSLGLKRAMDQLDRALLQNDASSLQSLLHKDLSYGHSNGWVQSKQELIKDGGSGKMVYGKIEHSGQMIRAIDKKWATVQTNTRAAGKVNGNEFSLSLQVMQVWIRVKRAWLLYARQSIKLP